MDAKTEEKEYVRDNEPMWLDVDNKLVKVKINTQIFLLLLHLAHQVHPLMPKPPGPIKKPIDVAKTISQIGKSSAILS